MASESAAKKILFNEVPEELVTTEEDWEILSKINQFLHAMLKTTNPTLYDGLKADLMKGKVILDLWREADLKFWEHYIKNERLAFNIHYHLQNSSFI